VIAAGTGHTAVRAQKRARLSDGEVWQKLELFPTPPWATRALALHVLPALDAPALDVCALWEPCAGLGHMSETLREYSPSVVASDLFLYPNAPDNIERRDFLDDDLAAPAVDWVVTNPPFTAAAAMWRRAVGFARVGVAFFCRLQWLEGEERYQEIHLACRPTVVAPFVERVALCEGGWDPHCSTATAYAWFVYVRPQWLPPAWRDGETRLRLIPPGRKQALSFRSDARLAALHVPGFVPPSALRRAGRQAALL
jgi:hypothetical protein